METFLIAKTPKEDLLSQEEESRNRMENTGIGSEEIEGEGHTTFGENDATRSEYFPNDGVNPSCDLEDIEAEESGLNVNWREEE